MTLVRPAPVPLSQHVAPPLSALDLAMARAVPPGGNWKDIPVEVPSKRLENIRRGYAAGTGSRSTYYGRLMPDRPSYTINTYFTRPGNGCHLHYDFLGGQHRTLTYREAARLQTFPDSFRFAGSMTSVAKQIGNAVPPLLGYLVARSLGTPAHFVDLFAGAGGLGLGFLWAGWRPVVANDIDATFLSTYAANIHERTVAGDIRDRGVFDAIVSEVCRQRRTGRVDRLWVLGGPPCQGFSTAGHRRSRSDERNHLFLHYKAMLTALRPDGFVFENVSGLLNMERGAVFTEVQESLAEEAPFLESWLLHADEYAIPQRRTRVILVGHGGSDGAPVAPARLTDRLGTGAVLSRPPVTCEDALGDLPPVRAGEDASTRGYLGDATTPFQRFTRGELDPDGYLRAVTGAA